MLIPRFIVRLDILELKNICLSTIKKHILKSKITRKLYDFMIVCEKSELYTKQPL